MTVVGDVPVVTYVASNVVAADFIEEVNSSTVALLAATLSVTFLTALTAFPSPQPASPKPPSRTTAARPATPRRPGEMTGRPFLRIIALPPLAHREKCGFSAQNRPAATITS